MLPLSIRMKKTRDFAAMATKGRSIFGFYSTLRLRSSGSAETKIAFIISTKIFKKAVDRNRAKRRFREAVRLLVPTFPKGFHYLFILKPQTLDGDFEKMGQDVAHMLEKVPKAMLQPLKISPRAQKEMKKGKVKGGARFVKPASGRK